EPECQQLEAAAKAIQRPSTRSALSQDTTQRPEEPAPQRLGPYTILERIGRGGMGVVYKARHVGLNRLVALKVLRAAADATARELARFQAEAQKLASLHDPHIVQIYEIGEEAGRPYFAMELVEGGSLAQQLMQGPLPADRAAQLVQTLAQAAQY